MDKTTAYELFETMIKVAEKQLFEFTRNSSLSIDHKADKSAVTQCDKEIDTKLTKIATQAGLQVVSEEGEHVLRIVQSGSYVTIDPIDGTLGYIDYVNYSIENNDLQNVFEKDLGAEKDFCLLLGIVENGEPRFGACYNYITKEKILIDSNNKNNFIRLNNKRIYSQEYVAYLDQRFLEDAITNQILKISEVIPIRQATLGLKSIYTIVNPHKSAVTVHRVQTAGLWDILPAAVACKVFGGKVYDDLGNPLRLDSYIILPGTGATIIKGEKFKFVIDELKKKTKAILFDFSRTLLLPADKTYQGDLNPLHARLKQENPNYAFLKHFVLNSALLDFLEKIKDKFKLYIFTSGSIQNAPEIRDDLEIVFSGIYSAETMGYSKKDPEAYMQIAKELNFSPNEICFVDDSQQNIKAASKAGLKTILFETNEKLISLLKKIV